MEMISADGYVKLGDRAQDVDNVREELNRVINDTALPTQIHPEERTKYLDAILDDLADREDAPWADWPEDLYLLALTAIKTLGRNPIGSSTLLSPQHLQTILHHTALPFPPSASPFSNASPPLTSPQALEALKVIANLLVLHASARDKVAQLGGTRAIARALAGYDTFGDVMLEDELPERLFLLGRIGFLVTLERDEAVKVIVDQEEAIKSLVYHLTTLAPTPPNYMAITELLKLVNNIIRFYPHTATSSSEPWTESFDALLAPCLYLLHSLPSISLTLPLSTTLHVLLAIPFLPHLLPIWRGVPASILPGDAEKTSPTSTTSSVKNLFNRMTNTSPHRRASSSGTSAFLHTSPTGRSKSPIPSRTKTPSPTPSPEKGGRPSTPNNGKSGDSPSKRFSSLTRSPKSTKSSPTDSLPSSERLPVPGRSLPPRPTRLDSAAFPRRVLDILKTFFEAYMPDSRGPDDKLEPGLVLDEVLPPVLFLLARAVEGDEEMRRWTREQLLPADLDRSTTAGPLEKRPDMLGALLQCMNSSNHQQTRDSAGEFMWALCDGDASALCAEIGYGNAAGLLFRKGISGPPQGKIQTINDVTIPTPELDIPQATDTHSIPTSSPSAAAIPSSATRQQGQSHGLRDPITALAEPNAIPSEADSRATFEALSDAEKEAETAKLLDLFERLDRNPILSARAPNNPEPGSGGGGVGGGGQADIGGNAKGKNMSQVLRDRYVKVDKTWGEKERKEVESEEREDEESVKREMEAYRRRLGR